MARKPEYRNPRVVTAILEAEVKEEIDQFRGRMSYGKVFTILWQAHKGEVADFLELENLRRENAELKAQVEELTKLVQKLQEQLERVGAISERERRASSLKHDIHEILSRYSTGGRMKMLELLKRLGYSSDFRRHARELLEEWFRDEGKILVSEELGLVVEKDPHYGEPAWVVKPLDSFRFSSGKVMEVKADV